MYDAMQYIRKPKLRQATSKSPRVLNNQLFIASRRNIRQNITLLLQLHDSRALNTVIHHRPIRSGNSIIERDFPKIKQIDQLAVGREVLDDPLGVAPGKGGRRIRRVQCLRGILTGRVILNDGDTVRGGIRVDFRRDDIAAMDGHLKVIRVVGVPLEPGIVFRLTVLHDEVDACLEDGFAVCVAVDADPCGRGTRAGLVPRERLRDDKGG